ncbi:sensor histidine kinase [Cohnella panacarvi]|uniref:sensor histidine kinase n=1 Tax=Cohnella panacarvi TaxID=400776 RepID=UPI0009FBCD2A|nr:histidine kinase [Cohnella panacarvi]
MRRFSIRLRLMILMMCLTTLPVLTVTWIATLNTRESVKKEIVNANMSRLLWAEQYLGELIAQVESAFIGLQINEKVLTGMEKAESEDPSVQSRSLNEIRSALTSVLYSNSRRFEQLTLYISDKNQAYSVDFSGSGVLFPMTIEDSSWSRMKEGPVNLYFEPSGDGIYAYHSINRFEDRRMQGGLSVRIDDEIWKEANDILLSENESSVYLLNDKAGLLTLSGASGDGIPAEISAMIARTGSFESQPRFFKTDRFFCFVKRVDDGELAIVKTIPIASVQQSANSTIRAGILTGLLFAVASLLLSVLVSLRISRPIVRLAKEMRMADPNQLAYTSVNTRDEIGLLERGYNSLVQRVKELIEHEYQREIDVKNAQLAALQAQINPHFLNNTLHMIGGMALSKQAPEIYQVTKVIGDLLRYSISEGEELVALDDEIRHMNNYLYIQQQRFSGRCHARLDHRYAESSIRLPKFTLQPLVENAFEHGLQRKEGSWRLDIRIARTGSRAVFLIRDGGVGMTRDRLARIRLDLLGRTNEPPPPAENDGPKRRRGIGLKNVDSRLRLRYGNRYRVRMFSEEGVGTLIAIAIPLEWKGDDDDAQRPSDRR